jgi:hypothetical protein
MSSFPAADEIIAAYEDQVEALERMLHARASLSADSRSRFYKLRDTEIQARLKDDRDELDLWAVLMLVASFEATVRTDAEDRIKTRTRDDLRRPLRDLYNEHDDRVRLVDILAVWEARITVSPIVSTNVRHLLKHRHWLAHGRHWANKSGVLPLPLDTYGHLDDYTQELQAGAPDYPRS